MAKAKKTETTKKPPKGLGKNGNIPPEKARKFSADHQPPPEKKSEGWDKKRQGEALAKAILGMTPKDEDTKDIRAQIAAFLGIDEEEVTVEALMVAKQALKALNECDTAAFNAVMNRAHGMPKQKADITSGDEPIKQVFKIGNQTIEF